MKKLLHRLNRGRRALLDAYRAWLDESLVRQTTVRVAVGLALIIAISTSITAFGTYFFLQERKRQELDWQADNVAKHFGDTLRNWEETLASLARNRVLANALLDSHGRDQYLVPFMREFDIRVEEHLGLTLCDYLRRPLAANGLGNPLCHADRPEFADTVGAGEIRTFLGQEGGHRVLVILVPVLYPTTMTVEGVLVGRLDLTAWFDNPVHFPTGYQARLSLGRSAVPLLGDRTPLHGRIAQRRIELPRPLDGYDFRLEVGGSQAEAPLTTWAFLPAPLLAALLLLGLGTLFARRVAMRLTRPLLRLAETSDRIAEGAHALRADTDRRDELGNLARNFNKMLDHLEAAQQHLEARIDERTRALAMSERRERQRAEELDLLLDSVPAMVMHIPDGDSPRIRVNAAMRQLLVACGLPGETYMAPEAAAALRPTHFGTPLPLEETPLFKAARQGSAITDFACEVVDDRGHTRHLLGNAYPIRHQDLQRGAIAAFSEITALKQAEQEVAAQAERYRRLFDLLPDGLVVYEENVIRMSNHTLAQLTGYASPEQLVGQHIHSFVHEDDRPAFVAMHAALARRGDAGRVQAFRLIRRDGSLLHAEISPGMVRLGDSLLVQAVIRDIGKRLEAEEQTRLAARVVEASQDGIFITDPQNNIISVNPAFTERTGHSAEAARGHPPMVFDTADRDQARAMWQALASTGHWENEVLYRHKAGHLIAQWLTLSAIRDGQGRLSHYIGVLSDVSDRKASLARMAFLAQHDFLTSLPNRVLLLDRLDQALLKARRENSLVAVLFLDLDGFKRVNDTYGHAVGDEVLKQAAERMQAQLRASDTVARLGGDEFIILLCDQADATSHVPIAEKLLSALAATYAVGTLRLDQLSASIGVALYPLCADDPGTLLEVADRAMYAAKDAGKNRHAMCNCRPAAAPEQPALTEIDHAPSH